MMAWHSPVETRRGPLHYPPIHSERVALTQTLYTLANEEGERRRYVTDPAAYAAGSGLDAAEQQALAALDQTKLLALGIHPLVFFLANLQIERQRTQKP